MKRVCLLVMLALMLLPFAVFANGGGDSASSDATKLTVWGRDLTDGEPDHAYVTYLVESFQANNSDIELEYIALGDPGLADKTKIAMASNSGPDIFQSWGGSVMGGYADAGRLLDMTAELSSVPGSAAAQNAMSWDGKIYGVAPFFAIAGLFVNEGVFADLGMKAPETIEELEQACEALLAKGIQPFACGAKDKWPPLATYMYLVNRYGGNVFNEARLRETGFDDPGFVSAAAKLKEWVEKGYFGDAPLGEAYGDAQQLMATAGAAMQVTGSWMNGQFSNPEFTDQKIGLYPFPVAASDPGKVNDVMGMTDIGFCGTKLAEAKKAEIVRFMKAAMSVDACTHEPGRICSVPGVPAPSDLTEMAAGIFGQAKTVQFWWDQDLPPTVTTPMNDTIQTFFLMDTDVAESLADFEALFADSVAPLK